MKLMKKIKDIIHVALMKLWTMQFMSGWLK